MPDESNATITATSLLGVHAPAALILSGFFGAGGIWASFLLAHAANAVLSAMLILRTRHLIMESGPAPSRLPREGGPRTGTTR